MRPPKVYLQVLLAAWLALGSFFTFCQAGHSTAREQEHGVRSQSPILQLRSGSHVALFFSRKAYFSAGGQPLTVEFLDTKGVMPRTLVEVKAGSLYASRKALYENLWPGVRLRFSLNSKGSCEATYLVDAGGDASQIRLHFDVPVKLQANGTLLLQFAGHPVTESSPEAWQDIDGVRVPVEVAFRVNGGEVGFLVGPYNAHHPLTIDPGF